LRQFDPSDVYFQGWLKVRDGERAVEAGKFLDAYNHYDKAANLFDTVALYHPEWQAELVKDRQDSTRKAMAGIREQALAEQEKGEKKVAGLIEGPGDPNPPGQAAVRGAPPLTAEDRRKVVTLQRQIRELRAELAQSENDRNANAAQVRRTLAELEAQRDQMARSPLRGQVRDLTVQLGKVQREHKAMATALTDSRAEHQRALADLATLRADMAEGQKRAAVLENNLNVQRQAANEVVRGLREQLKDLKTSLGEKDKLLAAANQRSSSLERQLRESHAEIADLREERNALLKERDHMAALLALNETDRVKLLIEQNMDLGKQLNAARENLQKVAADNNHTAEQLTDARRDLTIAKARILQLNQEKDQQTKRLTALEDRLRNEGAALTEESATSSDPRTREEIAILQGIINRQLKIQDRRRQSKVLLMSRAKALAVEDEAFKDALAGLVGDLQLTPEENRLVQENTIDGEFVWGDRPSKTERAIAGEELQENIRVKTNLARRAFSNDRFLVAREFFESILEEHPGHVPTWLNLGVVLLRNQEPLLAIQAFNDALALRDNVPLPYAQFMLGVAYYELRDLAQSRNYFQVAIDENPANAKAHVYLGSIAGEDGRVADAERNFQEAIKLNPTLTEPYFNLAALRFREGKKPEARAFYRKAIENGAQPDLEFEAELGS
jgi:Tfp pilus assembly protein PilF